MTGDEDQSDAAWSGRQGDDDAVRDDYDGEDAEMSEPPQQQQQQLDDSTRHQSTPSSRATGSQHRRLTSDRPYIVSGCVVIRRHRTHAVNRCELLFPMPIAGVVCPCVAESSSRP